MGKNFKAIRKKEIAFTLAEGATHVDLSPTKVKFAFTLAEVLITLGIIGIVAAMTIPNLIMNFKAQRLKSQFFRTYSIIQQVFKDMEAEGDSSDPYTYPTATFYKTFQKYITGSIDCRNKQDDTACYKLRSGTKKYRTLNGQIFDDSAGYFDEGQLLLQDGTLLLFEQYNGGEFDRHSFIAADLNGINNPPNVFGYDVFVFQFVDGEILPVGHSKTGERNQTVSWTYSPEVYCNENKAINASGWACAQLAVTDSDYFKKVVRKKIKTSN